MPSTDLDLDTLSQETGVPPRTIRSYIARGLVPKPLRPGRGATYPPEALNRLKFVRILLSRGLSLDLVEQAMNIVTDDDITSVVEDGEELRIGLLDDARPMSTLALDSSADAESETLGRLIQALRPFSRPRSSRRGSESWCRIRVTDDLELAVRAQATGQVPLQLEELAALLKDLIERGAK